MFLSFWIEEKVGGGVYLVVVEKIWMEWHLMRVNKESKRIMNLDPISVFRESWCIKFGGWWEWWVSQMSKTLVFPITLITVFRVNFEKSYISQFWSELPRSCVQIEAPDVSFLEILTSLTYSKYSKRYQQNGEQRSFVGK